MLDTSVKDWTSGSDPVPAERSYAALTRSATLFLASAILIWIVLFAIQRSFPYVQNGSEALSEEKWDVARRGTVFPSGKTIRVAAFGNSKTLAGFNPAVFDEAAGISLASYNFAIPGDVRFLDLLETSLKSGVRPTHLLVQQLPDYAEPGLLDVLRDDKRIVKTLFPFRTFVRDLVVFVYESRQAGGVLPQYREHEAQVRRFLADRGYFFIQSQSRFAGDRLPDGYSIPTDRPGQRMTRRIDSGQDSFARLMRLAEQFDFQVLLVPAAMRVGEFAPPPEDDEAGSASVRAFPRVRVVGPAYLLYGPEEFSDPVHLNRQGAERYSREIARLVAPWLGRAR